MMATAPELLVSIIVVGYQHADGLRRCLTALAQALPPSVATETILVANGATKDVLRVMDDAAPSATVVRSDVNRGFAGGCNLGAAHARGQYLALLNDDAEVESGWLEPLLETAERRRRVGAVGGKLVTADGARIVEAGQILWQNGLSLGIGYGLPRTAPELEYVREVDYCSAASLLVRRTIWEAVGGMDEGYFPAYFEDADLCLAIRRIGWRVLYDPRSRVRHEWGERSVYDFSTFLQARNVERFRRKWAAELASREPRRPESPAAVARAVFRARGHPRRLLIVDDRLPTAIGSGFGRMMDALTDVSDTDYAPAVWARTRGLDDRAALVSAGVEVVEEELVTHLREPHVLYDAIVISRPTQLLSELTIVRALQPQAAVVYDCEALWHRRFERQLLLTNKLAERAVVRRYAERLRSLELRIPCEVDRIVCVSEDEAQLLRRVPGACPVDVVSVRAPGIVPTEQPFAEREGAVFVAGWIAGTDSPNFDALRWLAADVLPRVRARMPSFKLRVTGAEPPEALRKLSADGIELIGHVENLRLLYGSARVAVSPVRYGAGVKVKTVEALQHGVPVVATPVGAEGCGLEDAGSLAPVSGAEAFAARLTELVTDEPAWIDARRAVDRVLDRWAQTPDTTWLAVLTAAQAGRSPGRIALHPRG